MATAGPYVRPPPPTDFSPQFFNIAPADQQLDGYLAGEDVRLINTTSAGQDYFRLPDVAVPIAITTKDELSEATTVVDTIIIEPEERRFSLLGKVEAPLPSGPQSLGRIIVGDMPRGIRKAVERDMEYLWPVNPRRAPVWRTKPMTSACLRADRTTGKVVLCEKSPASRLCLPLAPARHFNADT